MVKLVHPLFSGTIFHPLFSGITGVVEVVVKLIQQSKPLHVLTIGTKVLQFAPFNKSRPVFFCQIFVLIEGVSWFLQIFTTLLL
jgi:hypothetical protein